MINLKPNLQSDIETLCNLAANLDDYIDSLSAALAEEELRIVDLYHIIEFYDFTPAQSVKMIKELKRVLQRRRRIKNDAHLGRIYDENKSKLVSTNSRVFLRHCVSNAIKRQGKAKYNCRIYSHKEINRILGAKILPVEETERQKNTEQKLGSE